MTRQTLDQQSQFVILSVQFTQHLLQHGEIVRQWISID
jgi:hypothetical protein